MNVALNDQTDANSAETIMRKWFTTFDKELMAENVNWIVSDGYPVSCKKCTTRDQVFNDFMPQLFAIFKPWKIDTDNLKYHAVGNDVFVIGTYHGIVKSTGNPITVEFLHKWTVENGKITALYAVADTLQFEGLSK